MLLDNNERAVFRPLSENETIASKFRAYQTQNLMILQNKTPKWNEGVGAYVLNFHGRVTMASVKNFQLIQAENPG